MAYRCTNCGNEFDDAPDLRCPRCLRKTSVISTDVAAAVRPSRRLLETAWPSSTSCPLCLTRTIDASVFFLRISRITTAGYSRETRSITVKCRCCSWCRSGVERLETLRWAALPLVLIGMMTMVFSMASDSPLRSLGLSQGAAILVGEAIGLALVALPLGLVVATQRRLRTRFEMTELFQRARDAVPDPRGFFEQEHWTLATSVRKGARVIEGEHLEDAIASGAQLD